MKKLQTICYGLLILFSVACKKQESEQKIGQCTTGVVQHIGESSGTITEALVEAQGGSVSSDDGTLTVDIPAGALGTDVNVGIELISRTLVDAPENTSRLAYRLTPHGQNFAKPVTLRFTFTDEEFAALHADALGIAYQARDGKWKGMSKARVDKTTKTVSVETNHFSDWTTYETIYLAPKADFSVEVGESATLQVMSIISLVSFTTGEHLNSEEYYLEEPSRIGIPVDWRIVNGSGNGTISGIPTASSALLKHRPQFQSLITRQW
jgi:hypothetical protein